MDFQKWFSITPCKQSRLCSPCAHGCSQGPIAGIKTGAENLGTRAVCSKAWGSQWESGYPLPWMSLQCLCRQLPGLWLNEERKKEHEWIWRCLISENSRTTGCLLLLKTRDLDSDHPLYSLVLSIPVL